VEEDVVDGAADVGAEVEEFAINTVKGGLEEISFSWVFGVKKLE
jgi:hypothetical protein